MKIWLWAAVGILTFLNIVLLIKLYLLRKSAEEIEEAFADRLATDTNTLIDISSSDRRMRGLANTINTYLRRFQEERRRFVQGDVELKNAVTNISHDLRTPLTAIFGYLDLLAREEKSETVARYLDVIGNRTEMLKQLTEELFQYSVLITAKEEAVTEPVVINEILEKSIAAYYAALKEHHIVPDISMPEMKVIRELDSSALSRVFSNLLNNAMKYSDGDLYITLSETGEITFTNTASGLNEIQVGKLFDRFYTVEAARKSTGLGLAIARTLVEQMHGKICAGYAYNRLSICIQFPDQEVRNNE
ncbi:MAG: HAMP domain-containing sensor histidine kinase [Eubacteriales bacterium]|nr:HAMP domain-containing sensor histidine kinase [Eubacteriales bacterium]